MRFRQATFAGLTAAVLLSGADTSRAQDSKAPAPAADTTSAAANDAIRSAADPSAAVEAYADAMVAAPKDVTAKTVFVHRMVEFGLPELVERQARDVVTRNPSDGVSWAVLAYMDARNGRTTDALTNVVTASNRSPDDPFVQRTAGQLVAWMDAKADTSTLPVGLKGSVETMRTALQGRQDYGDAYRRAQEAYADEIRPGTEQGAAPGLIERVEGDGRVAAEPPVVVTESRDVVIVPETRTVYQTEYVYTDPFVYSYAPAPYRYDPWWPSAWCGGWGCGPSWSNVVIVGDRHRHFDHDRSHRSGFRHDGRRDGRRDGRWDGHRDSNRREDHARWDGNRGSGDPRGTDGRRGSDGRLDRSDRDRGARVQNVPPARPRVVQPARPRVRTDPTPPRVGFPRQRPGQVQTRPPQARQRDQARPPVVRAPAQRPAPRPTPGPARGRGDGRRRPPRTN